MSPNNYIRENSLRKVCEKYPVLISESLQRKSHHSQAIARQFQPSVHELESSEKEYIDPIGDALHSPVKGIVHRYPNRVLFIPSVNCPSYCRFCFRKARVGQEENLSESEVSKALDYIKTNRDINEVILSGGEPLGLSVHLLNKIFKTLDELDHIKVIRVHTRIQLTEPKVAIKKVLEINWPKKQLMVIIHCNHPDEIDTSFTRFVKSLQKNGAIVLSQSVLLKGINDSVKVLNLLFTNLIQSGVIPYYLHHPDLVKGAGHFSVSLKTGMKLMEELQGEVSGYIIPKYTLDLPGGLGKVPINKSWLKEISQATYEITSPFGQKIVYSDRND